MDGSLDGISDGFCVLIDFTLLLYRGLLDIRPSVTVKHETRTTMKINRCIVSRGELTMIFKVCDEF
jgi:hypothetical protein